MLPLSLLNASQGAPLLVELKSGESINGTMAACDTWMNILLKDVVHTSADGQKFKKVDEIYIRGTLIKYVRIPDSLLDAIKDERQIKREERREQDRLERERDFHHNHNHGHHNNNQRNRRRNHQGKD